ncbi:MAG: hypothetical protein M1818_002097 [Claussenomyces sp. TS43310]|nr:MAG: hypothetical protein M1818_002097 [Claussenomyces sp. TS43310]
MRTKLSLAAILALLAVTPIQGHSWVEDAHVVAGNGTMIGAAGYPRGNVLRTNPAFGDGQMTNLIPPNGRSTGNAVLPTDLMCKASQTIGNQTKGSPALAASPGDMVALRYQENGHVTLPQNQKGKAENRGTIFIYGTSQPSDSDTLLGIHNVWNAAGTGGDGRGVLLATQNFDDGQCYQANGGAISQSRQSDFKHDATEPMGINLWCQSDFTIPSSVKASGQYTIYWVWDWPTMAGTPGQERGLNETYTSCLDINMVAGTGTSKSLNFNEGQDLNYAAIKAELATPYVATESASAGASAATVAPTSQSPALVSSKAPSGAIASSYSGPVTVTVEAPATRISVTVTETIEGGEATASPPSSSASVNVCSELTTQSASQPTARVSAPHISPFMSASLATTNLGTGTAPQMTMAASATLRGRVVRLG